MRLVVFDFDDTLISCNSKVRVFNTAGGPPEMLTATQFKHFKPRSYHVIDFDEFEKYPSRPRRIHSTFKDLIKYLNDPRARVVIVSARENTESIRQCLEDFGIDTKLIHSIHGLGTSKPGSKAAKLRTLLDNDVTHVTIYEDQPRNIEEMSTLCTQVGLPCSAYLVPESKHMDEIPLRAAGLIVRSTHDTEVLESDRGVLVLFKHSGRVDLPKGEIDEGEATWEAALREASEEAGIDNVSRTDAYLPIHVEGLTFYVVDSSDEPEIRINPTTNKIEHSMWTWMNPKDCRDIGPTWFRKLFSIYYQQSKKVEVSA
jgi:8-oxo-dGTP pyrophosphatase MutT (NUDIX family)